MDPVIVQQQFLLRNMLCNCCLKLIHIELDRIGVRVLKAKLGDVTVAFDPLVVHLSAIEAVFRSNGFEIITDKETVLVEDMKRVVVELIHYSTFNAMVRNSDFLVSRFNKSYQHLSTIFTKHENITLEKYIILQRIEKVKELIQLNEFSLSEIAFMMGYSSVQYLSTQFKKITGYSVTDYKALPEKERKGAG